ncbi:helix-turn-helix transcriptional regulator [Sulfitobacter noctilucicola]|nr:helix-turn-helix transcriptional regulator [Sulfitobacter noctilucicola]
MPISGEKIKGLRLQAMMSQNKLARMADLDRTTVSNAERGMEISEITVHKLAHALSDALGKQISVEDIVESSERRRR